MPTTLGQLRQKKTKRISGVQFKSGYFYKFKYRAAENDRKPHIIFMYAYEGNHPNTGRQWRFFQAINFTYIPRNVRRRFMKVYLDEREKYEGNLQWDHIKRQFPWLKIAIRRYQYSPGYIIIPEEIPFEEAEDVIVSTWMKDFSKQAILKLRSKIRKSMEARGKKKKRKKKIISEKRFKSPRYWTHKDTPRQHGL